MNDGAFWGMFCGALGAFVVVGLAGPIHHPPWFTACMFSIVYLGVAMFAGYAFWRAVR